MSSTGPETGPDGVDLAALRAWFVEHVTGAADRPLDAHLVPGGRSNLTYVVSDGAQEWVLRRPPLGHVLPTAHDMAREHRVLSALAATDVPVPRTFAICADPGVIGAPFYVMERVEGRVLRTHDDLATLNPAQATRCSDALVDVLARIHSVDHERVGLGDFGHPDGYLERQVRRWGQQWERSKTRELPEVDELARRLRAALPEPGRPAIVHGDYRLENTMLAPDDPGRIVAVLDWEMATLGDPLTDLGFFLVFWGEVDGDAVPAGAAVRRLPGFLSGDEIVSRYAARAGRAVDALDWYVAFASYKLAVILEGIHARFLMGKTVGEGFAGLGEGVPVLAGAALERAGRSSIAALRR